MDNTRNRPLYKRLHHHEDTVACIDGAECAVICAYLGGAITPNPAPSLSIMVYGIDRS